MINKVLRCTGKGKRWLSHDRELAARLCEQLQVDADRQQALRNLIEKANTDPYFRRTAQEVIGPSISQLACEGYDDRLLRKARAALGINQLSFTRTRRGLRVLALDGGGTRALMTLAMLRVIEIEARQPIHEMFDLIAGCSTGAILAFFLGIKRVSVSDLSDMYMRMISKIFVRIPVASAARMVFTRSFYDPTVLTDIFKEHFGEMTLLDSTEHPGTPCVFAVATLANRAIPTGFLFRNYTYPSNIQSRYEGSTQHRVWEALRSTTAAPSFFPPYETGTDIFEDGAFVSNNPAALALHEVQRIWPGAPVECLVSLGTGRLDPTLYRKKVSWDAGWSDLLQNLIHAATGTETLHTVLSDTLPSDLYYRFNPTLMGAQVLDEHRASELAEYARVGHEFITSPNQHARVKQLARVLRGEHYTLAQKALPPYPFPIQLTRRFLLGGRPPVAADPPSYAANAEKGQSEQEKAIFEALQEQLQSAATFFSSMLASRSAGNMDTTKKRS